MKPTTSPKPRVATPPAKPTPAPSRTMFFFVGGALVLATLGAVLFVVLIDPPMRTAPRLPAPATSANEPRSTERPGVSSAPGSALPAERAAARVSADLAAVSDYVSRKQRAAVEEEEKFLEAGWALVKTAPPDHALVALDPALLPAREHELRAQLESASLAGSAIDNARAIAERAGESRTRRAAVDALGKNDSPRAQAALRSLFDTLGDEGERNLLVGHLRAKNIDDENATWLVTRLGMDGISDNLKKQMTFTLALASLASADRDGDPLAPLLERVPPTWRAALTESFRAVASR